MSCKAVFLDRDGVINIDINYLYKKEDFVFVNGIVDALSFFQTMGFILVIITNQSGIGRGYFSENDYQTLTKWMLTQLKQLGVIINKVYHCPYHPKFGIGEFKKESYDRKPYPGMILKAKNDLDIDLTKSFLIGDKETDIQAGINAGIKTNILMRSISVTSVNSKASFLINSPYEFFSLPLNEYFID